MLEQLDALEVLRSRGVRVVIDPPSATYRHRIEGMRHQIVEETLSREASKTQSLVSTGTTHKQRVAALNKLLFQVRQCRAMAPGSAVVAKIESDVLQGLHYYQLASLIEPAQRAEFKGQRKKAVDLYYEALYFLRHDDEDDSVQPGQIAEIEAKIRQLGGSIAGDIEKTLMV